MSHISNEKWAELKERMQLLGIYEQDLSESFILGGGSGGQKVNKTHSVVQLKYNDYVIRSKKSRNRDANRFFARRELCNHVAKDLGIPTKDDIKIKKAIKQKRRRKTRSNEKYSQ
tara:strand:- start:24 stop:368 length:345 start_codon:yes stop_codon:yes gene_type:complete